MLLAKRLMVYVYSPQVKRNEKGKFYKFDFVALTSKHFSVM